MGYQVTNGDEIDEQAKRDPEFQPNWARAIEEQHKRLKRESRERKTYLGDGLYAEDCGMQFELSCERHNGTNYVALEEDVLDAFFKFIERSRGVTITVTRKEQ